MLNGENHIVDSDEEDDPVIQEIPVYLSKTLADNLYVLRYSSYMKKSVNDADVSKVHVRPESEQLKFELDIDEESSYFDYSKAELMAKDITLSTGKDDMFENGILDSRVCVASKVKDSELDQYAVGCFNVKELHITPVREILEVKSDLNYLNMMGKNKSKDVKENVVEEEEAAGSSAQPVLVKMARFKVKEEKVVKDEPWVECNWYNHLSTLSQIEKQKLFSDDTEDHGQASDLNYCDYKNLLIPDLTNNSVSLLDRCKKYIQNTRIVPFQLLYDYLAKTSEETVEAILKCLPQVAVLVQGNWVIKTEFLYPKDTFSTINGVPSDIMSRSRDYILYTFNQNKTVNRQKLPSLIRLPFEEMNDIFKEIAVLNDSKCWELKYPTDDVFMSRHADVVQRQNLQWDQRWKQINETLTNDFKKGKRQRKKSKSVSEDNARKRERESDTDSGTERKSPKKAKKRKVVD